jgi:hypothetical protein
MFLSVAYMSVVLQSCPTVVSTGLMSADTQKTLENLNFHIINQSSGQNIRIFRINNGDKNDVSVQHQLPG